MSIESVVIDFLAHRKGRLYCDDCLARELRGFDRMRLKMAASDISMVIGFQRLAGTCAGCGGTQEGTKAR